MSKRANNENGLNLLERIWLECLWALCSIVGYMPHFVLYSIFAPTVAFILHRVIGYRHKVVNNNLTKSFPNKSNQEIGKIRSRFYAILGEIMVSTVALSNKKGSREIFPTINEDVDDYDGAHRLRELTDNRSWMALTAHFGLWEYLYVWAKFANQRIIGVYHPLENRVFNELFKRLRGGHKMVAVPAKESVRFTIKNGDRYDGESYVLGLIADQNPPYLPDSNWFSFLGRDTIFFEGGEKLARKVNLPTYFVFQRRLARGRYKFCFKEIWDGIEPIEPNEITHRYVKMLEQAIEEEPSMWLWSHRRWKTSRGNRSKPWMWARGDGNKIAE